MDIYYVIKKPIITEKSAIARDEENKYFFEVDRRANKIEISKAVEQLFKVKVLNVRTMNVRGKKRRMGKTVGKKSDWRKAIVTLASGDRIDIYEGV
ncbi:MAG: 50S ribosomal protein L23 [Thermodesulfobacteriota bacterium]|nr:50S ribosomal protein L23 [Thermodesulfobacteriota bacterium]